MVVGASRTGLSVSKTATLLGFSHSIVFRVYQEWSTTQRTSRRRDARYIGEHIRIGKKSRNANIGIGPMSSLTPMLKTDVKADVHTYIT